MFPPTGPCPLPPGAIESAYFPERHHGIPARSRREGLVAGKYLKELFALHEAAGTLDVEETDIRTLCERCGLPLVCREWDTVEELTCLCLESVLPA